MTVRWLLLVLGVAAIAWGGRLWARWRGRDVSQRWIENDNALRRREALYYEGNTRGGPWHSKVRDTARWTEKKR
jgi:hypothetical protein